MCSNGILGLGNIELENYFAEGSKVIIKENQRDLLDL